VNAFQVNGANPALEPELGKTFNLGLVGEVGAVSASLDWWRIEKKDNITTPTIGTAIANGAFRRQGSRTEVFTNLQNGGGSLNQGIDLDARVRLPGTALGNITLRNLTTYYMKQQTRSNAPGSVFQEFNGTYAAPRWRNTFIASFETGPWAVQGSWRSVAGFLDDDLPISAVAPGTRKVSGHDEMDLQVSYTGFKGWTLVGGAKNLFDNQPPFSATNATDNQYSQMGFAELYTSRGRYLYLSANYKFR
jgi:iron complex outermembrane recepter protein